MEKMEKDFSSHKVPLSGRLSYGLTDGCGNILYCIIGSYLLPVVLVKK